MMNRSFRNPLRKGSASALLGTLLRLVIVCGLVGAVLVIARVDPVQVWTTAFRWVETGVTELFGSSLEGVELIVTLVATGAVIVLPVWLVGKLLRARR